MGVGCPEEKVHLIVEKLHCRYENLPIKYLGLPTGVNPRSKDLWKPVVDKFEDKLSMWKR